MSESPWEMVQAAERVERELREIRGLVMEAKMCEGREALEILDEVVDRLSGLRHEVGELAADVAGWEEVHRDMDVDRGDLEGLKRELRELRETVTEAKAGIIAGGGVDEDVLEVLDEVMGRLLELRFKVGELKVEMSGWANVLEPRD